MSRPPIEIGYFEGAGRGRPAVASAKGLGRQLAAEGGWTLLWGLAAAGLIVAVAMAVVPPAALWAILAVGACGFVVRAIRRRRGAAILGYVGEAVALNLPLTAVLTAAAQSETGRTAQSLSRLVHALADGFSLADAVEYAAPDVSLRAVGLLRVAEATGTLPQALDRLAAEPSPGGGEDAAAAFYRWYPLILAIILVGAANLLTVFVVPKFQEIFRDLKIKLPPLFYVSDYIADFAPPLLVVLVTWMVLACGRSMWAVFRRSRPAPFGQLFGRLAWVTPFAHGLARDRGLADVFAMLDESLAVQWPLPTAIRQARNMDINSILQKRLGRWADGVEAGLTPADAGRKARLPALLAGMLASAQNGSDVQAVFQFLARYYRTRFSRTLMLLRGTAIPLVVVALGVVVGFMAVGLFQAVQQLIGSVAGGPPMGGGA